MKKTLFILFLLSFLTNGYAQYTVTKVVGTVTKKSTGELLKPGSSLNITDQLAWSSPKDQVRTIIAGKGIFTIVPSPQAQKEGSKLLEIVRFTLHIKSKEFNLSGRGENLESLPEALQTEDDVNSKNLIEPENKYYFDSKAYDVSNGSRFFLQIDKPGMTPEIKPLRTVSDTLLIPMSDFRSGNSSFTIETKYKLGYFSKEKNTSTNVIEIIPYFDSTSEMATIIKLVVAKTKSGKDKLKEICYSEVYQALGKPSDIVFDNVFNSIASPSPSKSH